MHAFVTEKGIAEKVEGEVLTICGLRVDDTDADVEGADCGSRYDFAYVCDVCFPPPGERPAPGTKVKPWRKRNAWAHGSAIGQRGFTEHELVEKSLPKKSVPKKSLPPT
jgi:hypothetical protein